MSERATLDDAQQRYRRLLAAAVLPAGDSTRLLQACLLPGAEAVAAWDDWLTRVGDPKNFFERDYSGLKGLLPFIQHSLNENRIALNEEFGTYLRVSTLREELRSEIYRNIAGEALAALHAAGIRVIALKGAALSETVYAHTNIRHNHAIDLLVHESELAAAASALAGLPLTCAAPTPGEAPPQRTYTHDTGLPLILHSQLFLLPYYQADPSPLWQRARPASIAGGQTLILGAADNLLHVCGHASYSPSRANLRWVCDALLIVKREPAIDWQTFVRESTRRHLTMPLSMMLEYLAREFRAPIPEDVLGELASVPIDDDPAATEAALTSVTIGVSPGAALRRSTVSWAEKRQLVRFLLFPPRDYVRWRYGVSNPLLLPMVYAYRPLKYLGRRLYRVLRRTSGQQTAGA